ncbi:MAG: DUF202 domain-containing protein [Kiritimatiellales bacterium]
MNKMNKSYSRFNHADLILRDELAIDRTQLANERTLLAYLRSAVALIIAGATIMNFSKEFWFWLTGAVCIPFGIIVSIIGILRYRNMNRSISSVSGHAASSAGLPETAAPPDGL